MKPWLIASGLGLVLGVVTDGSVSVPGGGSILQFDNQPVRPLKEVVAEGLRTPDPRADQRSEPPVRDETLAPESTPSRRDDERRELARPRDASTEGQDEALPAPDHPVVDPRDEGPGHDREKPLCDPPRSIVAVTLSARGDEVAFISEQGVWGLMKTYGEPPPNHSWVKLLGGRDAFDAGTVDVRTPEAPPTFQSQPRARIEWGMTHDPFVWTGRELWRLGRSMRGPDLLLTVKGDHGTAILRPHVGLGDDVILLLDGQIHHIMPNYKHAKTHVPGRSPWKALERRADIHVLLGDLDLGEADTGPGPLAWRWQHHGVSSTLPLPRSRAALPAWLPTGRGGLGQVAVLGSSLDPPCERRFDRPARECYSIKDRLRWFYIWDHDPLMHPPAPFPPVGSPADHGVWAVSPRRTRRDNGRVPRA